MTEPRVFLDGRVVLHAGDCREKLKDIPDNSIDAVCTDPPYALVSIGKRFGKEGAAPVKSNGATGVYARASRGFMQVGWDTGVVAFDPELWAEVLRCMKPGAHGLAMGGTRTFHRLVCAIEDAGAEIRDTLVYAYGSGFPKSLSVSKQMDKMAGAEREVIGRKTGRGATPVQDIRGGSYAGGNGKNRSIDCSAITSPSTDAAREWDGWGTALKPAVEMICVFRKPLSEASVSANVLRWGTGAINVGSCKIPSADLPDDRTRHGGGIEGNGSSYEMPDSHGDLGPGRWPANFILSWPADEYELRADITSEQKQELFKWFHENS